MPKGIPKLKNAPKIGRRIEMNEVPTPQTAEEVLKQAQTPATMEEQEKLKAEAGGYSVGGNAPSQLQAERHTRVHGYAREVLVHSLITLEKEEVLLKVERIRLNYRLDEISKAIYRTKRELFGYEY
jgi:hypothetical protein